MLVWSERHDIICVMKHRFLFTTRMSPFGAPVSPKGSIRLPPLLKRRPIFIPVTGRVSFRIVLFSPLNWAVDELEKNKLACLCDSNSPAGELVFLHLSGRQKSGGFRVFSNGDTECSSNGDQVGSC